MYDADEDMPVNTKHKDLNLNTENALAPNPYNPENLDKHLTEGRLAEVNKFGDMRLSHEVLTHKKEPLVADMRG